MEIESDMPLSSNSFILCLNITNYRLLALFVLRPRAPGVCETLQHPIRIKGARTGTSPYTRCPLILRDL